ncbi:MAG: histidine kinase [Flavobacteriales bacterium]|nr:histidine kinase [Flavobacteriales bacterium]
MNTKFLYWIAQVFGWTTYIVLTIILNIGAKELNTDFFLTMFAVWATGISLSQLLRYLYVNQGWLDLGIIKLIPRVLPTIVIFGVALEFLYYLSQFIITSDPVVFGGNKFFSETISWFFLFLMWTLFYFSFHFFQNYRKEEIKNLQWEASKNEIELNRLRAQLNPHFIFNSMNTIRALVDDNPKKSKKNITKLSKILRSTLLTEKKKFITLEEELDLVKDYLDLEHSRFEERLNIIYNIAPNTSKLLIPPMMLQTLVENSIKHGISQLPEGGIVAIKTSCDYSNLYIEILNSGTYQPPDSPQSNSAGFGLSGTVKRLELLYGAKGVFEIYNKNNKVVSNLTIPQTKNDEYYSDNN